MIKRGLAVVRFALDHPILSAVAVSFGVMSLVVGIEAVEKDYPGPHPNVALVKQGLCLIAIPGFLVLMFWTPGLKGQAASRMPRWVLPAAGAFVAAIVFYHALKIFLAAR